MKKRFYLSLILLLCLFIQINFAQTSGQLLERAKDAIEKKNYESAVKDLTSIIALEPNNAEAYAQRARANFLSNKADAALVDAEKALSFDAKNTDALNIRGLVKYSRKDYDAALADFSSAIGIKPDFVKALVNRGRTLSRKKDYASAINDFNAAIKIDANFAEAYYERAYAESVSEMWNAAESDFGRAYELGKNDTFLFNNLAYVQLKMKQYVWAAVNARLALEIDPQNEDAKNYLNFALASRQKPFDGMLAKEMIEKVAANNIQGAVELMNQGAEVNATIYYEGLEKMTPLLIAAMNGNFQLVRALIAVGADVNYADANGYSPLFRSTYFNRSGQNALEVLKLLIKNGADVNRVTNKGETALHQVASQNKDQVPEAIEILLKAGAKVDLKDENNLTPLFEANRYGTTSAVRALLAAGANPNVVDNFAYTPLIYAVRRNGFGLTNAWLLLKAGAKVDLPLDEKTSGYEAAIEAVKQMAALPKDSVEAKLFDAVADNNAAELQKLLAANPSIDKTMLNWLLMMSVPHDNTALLRSLIAAGADPNYYLGDSSAVKIAKAQNREAAKAYLASYASSDPRAASETATRDANTMEAARLISEAAGLMKLATNEMNAAYRRRDEGADKRTWCLRVEESANDVIYAIKNLDRALTLAPISAQAEIKAMKQAAAVALRDVLSKGCPIFLKQ